jgi:hypothetical protein
MANVALVERAQRVPLKARKTRMWSAMVRSRLEAGETRGVQLGGQGIEDGEEVEGRLHQRLGELRLGIGVPSGTRRS